MADDLSHLIWLPPRKGTCGEAGPWGTRCTEYPVHDYAHYDASDDSSWTTDVMEDFLLDHPEVTPPSDYERIHERILVEGEIPVCKGCRNSEGNYVAWDQAHPESLAEAGSGMRAILDSLSGKADLLDRQPEQSIDTEVEPWFRAESDQWNAMIRKWCVRLQTQGIDDSTTSDMVSDFRTIVGTDQDTLEGFAMHLLLSLAAHVPEENLEFP